MSIKPNSLRLPIVILFLFLSLSLYSQIRIASPYSRFGIGDLSDNNNAWNLSMGQTSYAFSSPYHINYSNPASYMAFDSSSFVFEGGFNIDMVKLSSNYQTTNRNYASLGYLLFGFPVTKWWHTTLGLVPFSDVGYSVANYEEYDGIGSVLRIYSGSGGINRFFWGNAFRIVKNLSVGINASYLFGTMNRQAMVLFPDSAYSMNFKVDNDIIINDLYFNFGIQYKAKLNNNLFLNLGAVYAHSSRMSAKTNMLAQSFLLNSSDTEIIKDTIAMAEGYKGKIIIPTMIGGGLALEKPDKFLVGIDFKWQNWSKFTAFDMSDSLVDSWQIHFGAEFLPNANNYNNYLSRVRYRIGFFYDNSYLKLREKHLSEYAVTLGFGLPLRGVKTALNVGFQLGTRGTTQADLIRESYLKLVIGFSIYERWFVKRKYY